MSRALQDHSDAKAAPCQLAVTYLRLTNFRSYGSAELSLSGAPVVLAGPNGAGKTNILEAISLLSPGRGLRGAKLGDHIRKTPSLVDAGQPLQTLWAVSAIVTRAGIAHQIGTGLSQNASTRQVHLNGAPAASSAELGEIVQAIWLTPAMDRLFIEGASARRRFLDRLVLSFSPSHARNAGRYETALRERMRLLKYGPRDPVWLDGLENEMAEAGLLVAQERAGSLARLSRALAEREKAGIFPAASLSLSDELHLSTQEDLRKMLRASRLRDAQAGRALVGPHTTDLGVRHTFKRAEARECSTGEQKALLISIILASTRELTRMREGIAPILLLDEIAAHLDSPRRDALFEEIAALKAQAWMTGTDLSFFKEAEAEFFLVEDGRFLRGQENV